MPSFYEFFAGGGMARAGLGAGWQCLFANDFDPKKAASYRLNWGGGPLHVGDVAMVRPDQVKGSADLAWASFPCQDLSLAGGGAGLKGKRSGTFWPFWELMGELEDEGRAPKIIALENVCGTLASHGGKDFSAIGEAFASRGYRFGAIVVDAALFVPQSRPRLFIIGVRGDCNIPSDLVADTPVGEFHTRQLIAAHSKLAPSVSEKWVWWKLPVPRARKTNFVDLLDNPEDGAAWHTPGETKALLDMMSPINMAKVKKAQASGKLSVGCVYKRTRRNALDNKVQRAEVRFDGVSGCLRTPAGGSSRQVIIIVEGEKIRSRLITARETARLMGLKDSYKLPDSYNDAYHLTGDGVAVPVVRHIAKHILEPVAAAINARQEDLVDMMAGAA